MDNILQELNKLIEKYNWTPRPIPMEIVEDLTRLRTMIDEPKDKVMKEKPVVIDTKEEIKQEGTTEQINQPEEKTIEQLRIEYKNKYNKKPFGWWSYEVLVSKLK